MQSDSPGTATTRPAYVSALLCEPARADALVISGLHMLLSAVHQLVRE